jgi:D-aspartate ligase
MRPYPPGLKPNAPGRPADIDRFGTLRDRHFEQTPAVIVGAAGACGLGVMRSLRAADVPVVILDTNARAPAMHSREAHGLVVDALAGRTLVDDLLALRQVLPGAPLLFLTSDEIALTVSQFRIELAASYRIRLPAHERLVALMDKPRFQEFAEAHGFPVPRTATIGAADDLGKLAQLRFPCVIKPAIKTVAYHDGGFARGYRVASREEAEAVCRRILGVVPVVTQEWIEGPDSELYFCLQYRAGGATVASFCGRKLSIWPPDVGMTASCTAAHEVHEILHPLTEAFFAAVGFEGMGSMEFKRDARTGQFLMIEPTVGRVDWQEEVATLNGVNIPLEAYRHEMGLQRGRPTNSATVIWRDTWMHWKSSRDAPARHLGRGSTIRDAYWRLDDPLPAVYRVLGGIRSR